VQSNVTYKNADFLCIEKETRLLRFVTLMLQFLCSLVTEYKLLDLFELKSMVGQSFATLSRDFDFTILDHSNTLFRKGLNNEALPKTSHEGPDGEQWCSCILS
jgi:hypothetical protein